jgi:hypothetical protein
MKKIITLTFLIAILSLTSCKKKASEPSPTATSSNELVVPDESISVQYRVTSASGHFNVEYTALDGNTITVFKDEISKSTFTYSFYWVKDKNLRIKAYNITPSTKKIIVEIYVNGVLFKSGSANQMDQVALAEGVYTN